MEQQQLTQYYNALLQWVRFIKNDHVYRGKNDLQDTLTNFENRLLNLNMDSLSYDLLLKEAEKANELYREFNPDELFNESHSTDVKRKKATDTTKRISIGDHKLPSLPYAYNALEPYIDEEIMRLHHSEHHKSYVDGLNKAEKEMEKLRKKGDFELIKHWEREAAFHGAGHYLHSIFWNVMSPKGGGTPIGALRSQIETDFGSFDQFKKHFSEAAKKVEAVGWAILVWSPRTKRLEILQAEKHQNLSQWDVVPLLPLDVWEHAYYLQYKNNRGLYVDNWWNIVNWEYASKRFQEAKSLQW